MDRTLSLEFARVVEAAALRSGRLLGRGQKDAADGLAVDAMRQAFDSVRISGTVVIGEGEIDEAPMLYIGEHVGAGGPEVDIADIFAIHGIETEIIAASVRTPLHIIQCAKAGAHIATVPFKVLMQAMKHPLTDAGLEKFMADWKQANQ